MSKPKLLDLFCGAGGAGVGYRRAGFKVTGVDLSPMPNYPFTFHQADALEFVRKHGHKFDVIHASPPCQGYTTLQQGTNKGKTKHPLLIEPTRELLESTGLPYIMENVPPAPLRADLVLCGEMFGLGVIRHRKFESNVKLTQPAHLNHRGRVAGMRHGEWFTGPYFAVYGDGGGKGSVAQWQEAMGIDWTDVRKEIAEAIPPAYSQYIGTELRKML